MASIGLLEAFIALLCFLIIFYHFLVNKANFSYVLIKKTLGRYPWNWPVLGMLPGGLLRLQYIYDCSVEILENSNLTFQFKGPWFVGMDVLVTVDPANVHHIMSSNFSNYIKGPIFHEIFEAFGDGIINSDSELWRNWRNAAQTIFNHQRYQNFSASTTKTKLKDGLVPLFNHFADEEMVVDLQDVFQRFMFDITFNFITGFDPRSLSIGMPEAEFSKALDDVGDAIVHRHITPRFVWKLQQWIGIGTEKTLLKAHATLDRVCAKFIAAKREELRSHGVTHNTNGESEDLLTSHIMLDATKYELLNPGDDKFLRDFTVGFMAAGRDSTASALTWFFWNMSENPNVLTKILQEINTNLPRTRNNQDMSSYLNKLVYLHCALSESMRLYPPIPFERKSPIKEDELPSGHKVKENINIMIFIYAMGRMKTVWGEDAMEFKPERWISETGGLRHEPSYKFLSFNAGPRTCLGKNLAMTLMKTVIVKILQNYEIKVVSGQKIEPKPGLILHMKYGLKVTMTKKCSSLE
ncbi:PREDICTED: alkane hydroxylase MAH1 [Camelina sativa]|uniref:Alkane hydroxylase MAH1 n=1 Tax=Camelina sativa TaxID=90675 RepID=A0ABM0X1C5_CAMSA|nr:PREDICTED: alkane hydroxylase MAH1 [Camelina sativa]